MATFLAISAAEPAAVNRRGIMRTRTRNFLIYSILTFTLRAIYPNRPHRPPKVPKKQPLTRY
jgi:hypothetical protein